MSNYSIDIETLGTNFNDTILSVGICEFDLMTGDIKRVLEVSFDVPNDETINCTLGTIKFWLTQAVSNPRAVEHVFNSKDKISYVDGLEKINKFLGDFPRMWANGTKFDLGMLEQLYKDVGMEITWDFNSDRCMRTLRGLCGRIDINMGEYSEIAHTALSDAIWQAKYIAACHRKLGITL